jgi:iron complex outermembrane receptor protein
MKYLFFWLLTLATISTIYSQHSIKGQITNKDTNEGLSFANIYFPELEKGSTTNEEGYFELMNLPTGKYKIVCSFIGFETYSSTIDIPTDTTINIEMSASAIEMEEIIVSTPFHKLQSDNVMKVEQQKVSDLKRNGAVTLSEGITNIAGVESISTGLSIGKPVIRGLSSNRVLVYTQGIRLENQQFGDEHGLGINDAGIESIEVIKGPASLLYGSDALGGVLYLNPERFANQNESSADASFNYFTNTQGYNTNLGFKSSSDYFKLIFRGSLAEHSDYDTEDFRVTNSRFKEQDFKSAMGYQKNNFKTEIRYNLNASQLGIPEEIGLQSTETQPMLPYQAINNHIFSSRSSLFLENSSFDLNLGYTYNDRKEFEEHHHDEEEEEEEEEHEDEEHEEDLEAALHMKLKTFNYDAKYNLPRLGKFETIVGVQGMHQVNSNYGEEELIPDATTNDVGVLATSHIHFETVDVQLGARYDNRTIMVDDGIRRNFNSFNAALGAKTNLSDAIVARLNLASGFRAPNLAELTSDGAHEGTNRYEIGNPDLNNEQNFQADLALELKSEHLEVFANLFYNNVNNYIFIEPTGTTIDGDAVFVYNQSNANLYGGEFGLHFHPHPLDWLHFESSFATVTGKQSNDDYLPLIPANKLDNTVRFEFGNNTFKSGYGFVKLSTAFEQNNVSAFETMTPSYSLWSAGLGVTISAFKRPLTLSVSGTNLSNKVYVNHLSRLKGDGIPNMGRSFNIGLNYKI